MIETEYMEQPVDDQGEEPLMKRDGHMLRLHGGPLKRDYNITDHFTREFPRPCRPVELCRSEIGEGDHVGGPVPSEELVVEYLYLPVADKQDAYIPTRQL